MNVPGRSEVLEKVAVACYRRAFFIVRKMHV